MSRIFRGFVFSILIFSFCLPLYPESSKDQNTERGDVLTLEQIDSLIKDTNYEKALSALNIFIRENPEQFDSAQKRVKRILNARNRYTILANQLIQVIQDEPGNAEKILAITNQLEALEKHPSDKQLAFIEQTKVAAQFSYYRSEFVEVQKETADLISKGSYTDAADKARSGFYMYQDDFFDQYKQESVVKPVREAMGSVDTQIASYKAIQGRLITAVDLFIAAADSGNAVQAQAAFDRAQLVFRDFANIRNNLCAAGWQFQTVFGRIKKQAPDATTDASFLPFASRFTLGRSDDTSSGIAGAMDSQWNMLTGRMKNAVTAQMVKNENEFSEQTAGGVFSSNSPGSARYNLSSVRDFASVGSSVNSLYALLKTDTGGTLEHAYPNYLTSVDYASILARRTRTLLEAADSLSAEKRKADALAEPSPLDSAQKGSEYTSSLIASAKAIERMAGMDGEGNMETASWSTDYRKAKESGALSASVDALLPWESLEKSYKSVQSEAAKYAAGTASALWTRSASYYAACGKSYTETCTASVASVQQLLDKKYPKEAADAADKASAQIAADKNILTAARKLLGESSYQSAYAAESETIASSIVALDSLIPSADKIASAARTQVLLAKRAQNEADLRYSQAQQALKAENFDSARKRLQEAREKYNEALSYQDSETLRRTSDENLQTLGGEISRQQNEIVVRDVRKLKNQAKTEYYNGNFDTAENLLNQAKSRWALTNVDEDAEISNLFALVGTALSMKTGRVIPPTAPLYPEMSQILSIATQYYNKGSSLIKKGRRLEGNAMLDQALAKLKELQLVYPLNQEAALLTLRIQQVTDKAGFARLFEQRVNNARRDYRNPAKQQTAYADLLDLYEINPDYPGLKQLIYDVEIAIGVRRKPVDNTSLIQSKQLSSEAQRIVDSAGRDEVKLRQALAKVDKAIELNPDNDTAMFLKDKIQMSIGGRAAVVLSSEDEAKYQQAIQELQKNNIITANAIVEQLLQKNENKRSAKILELQKKIKALL